MGKPKMSPEMRADFNFSSRLGDAVRKVTSDYMTRAINMMMGVSEDIHAPRANPDDPPLKGYKVENAFQWTTTRDPRLDKTITYKMDDLSMADLDEISRMHRIGEVTKIDNVTNVSDLLSELHVTYRHDVEPITLSNIRPECRPRTGKIFDSPLTGSQFEYICHMDIDYDAMFKNQKSGKTNAQEQFRRAGYVPPERPFFSQRTGQMKSSVKFHTGGRLHGKTAQQKTIETDFITGKQMRNHAERAKAGHHAVQGEATVNPDIYLDTAYEVRIEFRKIERLASPLGDNQWIEINESYYRVINAQFGEA